MLLAFYNNAKRKIKRFLLSYSRVILVLKTWLLCISGLCLGFFFIYPQLAEHQRLFDVSISTDMIGEAESVKITNLRYYAIDDSNTPYIVTARSAEEKKPGSNVITLDNPMADLISNSGDAINVTSRSGKMDQNQEIITLNNDVEVFSTSGYELRSQELSFNARTNIAYGNTPIDAKGIFGSLSAEGFEVQNKGDKVHFKGKTKINLYER